MENFHAATTFELLRKEKNNFLSELSTEEFKKFRKFVISNILFTDIKEHFPLLKKFN
jgi:cAMP-specific phosphodiesterase 4